MKNKQIKWGSEILKAKPKTKRNEEAGENKTTFSLFFL